MKELREANQRFLESLDTGRGRLPSLFRLSSSHDARGIGNIRQLPCLLDTAVDLQVVTGITFQNVFIEGYSAVDGPDLVV